MADFDGFNTRGIKLDSVLPLALKAESTRDFSPMFGDLAVGLSSGTSGNRGVFLVSRRERLQWAGAMLARALPGVFLRRLMSPWREPIRVAFFLRANSNLYGTLGGRRIRFVFYDLLRGVEWAIENLVSNPPDILVGPPQLLRALAAAQLKGRLRIRPEHVISVADVLEESDSEAIRQAFGITPHQIYQAMEGFLGYTCSHGRVHLNETFIHFEREWLDNARTRFQPVITDFTRETQVIARYRLNDVLRVSANPCPCGRADQTIDAIEGRTDEVLWMRHEASGNSVPVFPDFIRRAMLQVGDRVEEFEVQQRGSTLVIGLLTRGDIADIQGAVSSRLSELWRSLGVVAPALCFTDWTAPLPGEKRRRVRLVEPPAETSCTF